MDIYGLGRVALCVIAAVGGVHGRESNSRTTDNVGDTIKGSWSEHSVDNDGVRSWSERSISERGEISISTGFSFGPGDLGFGDPDKSGNDQGFGTSISFNQNGDVEEINSGWNWD